MSDFHAEQLKITCSVTLRKASTPQPKQVEKGSPGILQENWEIGKGSWEADKAAPYYVPPRIKENIQHFPYRTKENSLLIPSSTGKPAHVEPDREAAPSKLTMHVVCSLFDLMSFLL